MVREKCEICEKQVFGKLRQDSVLIEESITLESLTEGWSSMSYMSILTKLHVHILRLLSISNNKLPLLICITFLPLTFVMQNELKQLKKSMEYGQLNISIPVKLDIDHPADS